MDPCRILIVEDEAIVAMDIEDRLAGMGYELAGRAASGEHALALVESQHPNLVLMDIRLQGAMDGVTAAEEIRHRFHLPVIFVTAYSEEATLDRAKLAEPFGYILKPFDDRELRSAIEIARYKHGAEEEIRRLNRLYDVLSQVNQAIVRIRSREELLSTVCRLVVERGAMDLAWIGWLDPATSRINPIAHFGIENGILSHAGFYANDRPEGQGNPGQAIREGKPFVCNECGPGLCPYPSEQAPARFGFHSCASFPLRFQGQVWGVLSLCASETGFFLDREMELLEEVAMDISFALDKIAGDTQRERLNEELRHQAIFLQTLMDAMPYPVFYKDVEFRYLGCNKAFEQLMGLKRDQIIGKTANDLWPRDLAYIYHHHDKELLGTKGPQIYETTFQNADGVRRQVLFHKATFRNQDGSLGGIVGAMEDITERKHAEEERTHMEAQLRQAQKMEALGTLAGGIAHDFNNILAIIIGYTEIAQSDMAGAGRVGADLQEVLTAARRAKDLVRQILAFSRRGEQEKMVVQVGLIVKEAMKMLRASLPSTIDFKMNVASKAVVMADPTQIHQVLMNLCTNAAHAMREAGGVLEVSLTDVRLEPESIRPHSGLEPGLHVKLVVTDTGHGIDPAIMDRIFDPFFTTKEQGAGTGLGLSVVHGIVRSLGGAIGVESVPGKGAVFNVLLPAMESAGVAEPVEAEPLPRGRERILFVDDEPALARATKQMLQRLGYEVDCRASPIEALEAFRLHSKEKPFDLVITDMTMPHLSGADLARELIRLQPGLPVILCTGFSEKMNAERARSLGIKGFLLKPVLLNELAVTIRKVLGEPEHS
jgi:PAS domain S-box-containing protein